MMWALIDNGEVREITDIDPDGRYHEDFVWVVCPEEVRPGWLYSGGNFSAPPEQVPVRPSACTPAQGLVALFALKNITEDNVLAAIGQIPDPVQQYTARIGYQRATVWERNSPTMQVMAQLLQLSAQDLDALFAYAVEVRV